MHPITAAPLAAPGETARRLTLLECAQIVGKSTGEASLGQVNVEDDLNEIEVEAEAHNFEDLRAELGIEFLE